MERVMEGEPYWYIDTLSGNINVCHKDDDYIYLSDETNFNCGNYFHSREEAEKVASKIRAVLKGAEVIEMPSEEEWEQISISLNNGFEDSQSSGIREAYNYLKSKIVK